MTSSIFSWFFWLLLLTEKKNKIEDEFLANSMMIYIFFLIESMMIYIERECKF